MVVCRKGWIIICAFLLQECFSKNCGQRRQWASYLSGLYCLLSSFYFQEHPAKFNVELTNWGKGGEKGIGAGINIKDSNFKDFLKIMETYSLCLNQTELKQEQLKDLNSLLKVTLAKPPHAECFDDTFVLHGTFVKMSDLPEYPLCGNIPAKRVEVLALETIYFDRHISTLQDVHLSIIGKRWAPGIAHYKLSSPNKGSFLGINKFMDQNAVEIDGYSFSTKPKNELSIHEIKSSPKFAGTTLRYKSALRKGLGDRVVRERILKFLMEIETHSSIRQRYRFSDLVRDIKDLENYYCQLFNNTDVDFLPFYNILLDDILRRIKVSDHQDKRMLNFLYLSLVSRKGAIEENKYMNLEIDMRNFSDTVLKDVRRFEAEYDKSQSRTWKLDEIKKDNQEKKFVLSKIWEVGNNTIKNFIKKIMSSVPLIKTLNQDIDKTMAESKDNSLNLINEIFQPQETTGETIADLKVQKTTQLAEALRIGIAGRAIKIIGSCLGVIQGVFTIVGAISSMDALAGLVTGDSTLGTFIGIFDREGRDPEISDHASETFKVTFSNASDLAELQKLISDKIESKFNENPCHEVFSVNKTGNESIVTGLTNIALTLQNSNYEEETTNGKIEILEDAISKIKEYIQDMAKIICDICHSVFPMLKTITEEIKDLGNKLGSKTQVERIFTKWQMVQSIQTTLRSFSEYYRVFRQSNKIKYLLQDVNVAANTITNIFSLVDAYKDTIVDVKFQTGVAAAAYQMEPIEGEEFIASFSELNSYFYSNAVLFQYKALVNAIKQYSFPFAHKYITELHLPKEFNVNEDIKSMISRTERIKNELDTSDSKLYMAGEVKPSQRIFRSLNSTPFYIWKDPEAVYDLLSGKEVKLKADIRETKIDLNAVKFNIIGLVLRSEPSHIQRKLDMALTNRMTKMQHLGDSNYNCNGKLYFISTPSTVFRFYYKEEAADVEDIKGNGNDVYQRYGAGNYVLSPYATWLIQIENPVSYFSFEELKHSINDITIELIGRGQYFEKEILCPDHLDEYYYELDLNETIPPQNDFSQGKTCVAAKRPIIVLNQDENEKPLDEITAHL